MTQSQLNRAISRATGDDCEVIEQRGFGLVDDECPVQEDDMQALIVDWDRVQAEQTTAMFRDRQAPQVA